MSIVIQGRTITEGDIGKTIKITKSSSRYLPVGYLASISEVEDDYICIADNEGDDVEIYAEDIEERGLLLSKDFKDTPKSTASQRKKLAKAVKEARKALEDIIKDAEEVGMEVKGFGQEISFQPPLEKY